MMILYLALAVLGGMLIGAAVAMFGMRKINKAYRSAIQDGCQLIGDARRMFVREGEPDRQHESKVATWRSRTFDWEARYTDLIRQTPTEGRSGR